MLWFIIALSGYLLLALATTLDKFIISDAGGKPIVYTFYSTIIMFGAAILFPIFGFTWLWPIDMFWALVSGVTFGLALWAIYKALDIGEASHMNPFNGAFITIFSFLLASAFLGESLTTSQNIGVVILISASVLLSFEKSKKHSGFHIGFVWSGVSGLLFAISHVSAKYLYTMYDFWPAFTWTRFTTGFVGLFILMSPTVWKTFKTKKKGKRKKTKKALAEKYAVPIMISNKVFAMLAVVFIQFAAAIGSVTLVLALSGLQYAFMFFIIIVLTKFFRKWFKEYFTKKELVMEWVAIGLVVVGSALFVL